MQKFKKILFLLSPSERKNASLLLLMILIMALLDCIGVASILPFVAVLTNPDIIQNNIILNKMFIASNILGVENDQQFLFALGILVFIILVFSLLFKAITTYTQIRFILMREYSIGKRLVEGYLHQPYSWFLNRNSADLGKTILSEVSQVIGGGLKPVMDVIAQGMIATTLVILLIASDPKLAIVVGISIGGAYGVIFYFTRVYLNRIGKERLKFNLLRFKSLNEAFGASKEVKVGGLEQSYIQKFSTSAQITARTSASSNVINQIPRFFLEAITFGGILLIILYMMAKSGSFNKSLPIISLYVFAGYRLMPAVQQIYVSFAKLAFIGPSLDKLYNDLKNLKPINENQDQGTLLLKKSINLKNIYYSYPSSTRSALKNINIKIPAKSTIGLVGTTGSGKTTTVDVILGLLMAEKGSLEVDGKVITGQNTRAWQRSIGYVPQSIYLSDDTISSNIAFGVKHKNISQETVRRAAKIANLHEFITEELSEQYDTTIGERGIRLSGGQRQRLGIARALYHNPKLLILDEATSALDNKTEKDVMDAVYNLRDDITVILIAHRLSTVKKCDKIFLLEKGSIKNEGTFEELIKVNENFRLSANN